MIIDIDPVIFSLGPLQVRWYGLMYVIGFIIAGSILKKLVNLKFFNIPLEKIDSLVTHMLICMFLGARFFYVFIYNWDYYSQNLSELMSVWKGGLSFHGALVGLIVAGFIFAKKNNISGAEVLDSTCVAGTQGLFFGRMGNFINGELYGRVTDSPVGLIFAGGGPYPRHPSQLYEGIMEGLVLSLILWFLVTRVKRYGVLSSVFLMGYACFRFVIEFFRQPDVQLGYYFEYFTMGQILCFFMFLLGLVALYFSNKKSSPILINQVSS